MDITDDLSSEQLNRAIQSFIESVHQAVSKLIQHHDENMHVAINQLLEAWLNFSRQVLRDEIMLSDAQINYWQDYLTLCEDLHQKLSINAVGPQVTWRDDIIVGFIERFCSLISHHSHLVLKNIFNSKDADENKRIEFYSRQLSETLNLTALLEGSALAQTLN